MKPIDLLKLAEQADREGRYAIADKLTIRATRIAATPPLAEIMQAGERGLVHGLETGATEAERAAAEAILARIPGGGPGHVANTGNIGSTVNTQGGIHAPMTMTEKVVQEAEQEVAQNVRQTATQTAPVIRRPRTITVDGKPVVIKDQSPEYLRRILPELSSKDQVRVTAYLESLGKKPQNFNKQKVDLEVKQTGSTGGGDSMKMEAPVSTSTGGVHQQGSPSNLIGKGNLVAADGSTINMGVSNAALLGGMGIVGVTGALGVLGMYLGRDGIVRDRDNVVVAPQNIPADIARRLPRYQTMTRREEAGQLGGQRALDAQNFIDANASNPRVKNQRDWYNLALQTSGGDKNFANNVISYVKASPEMPSQVGGGPNI
jgi:hypothetical protein